MSIKISDPQSKEDFVIPPGYKSYVITIEKPSNSHMGLSLTSSSHPLQGYFQVRRIIPGSLSDQNGNIQVGDHLIMINGTHLKRLQQLQVVTAMRAATGRICLALLRQQDKHKLGLSHGESHSNVMKAEPRSKQTDIFQRKPVSDSNNTISNARKHGRTPEHPKPNEKKNNINEQCDEKLKQMNQALHTFKELINLEDERDLNKNTVEIVGESSRQRNTLDSNASSTFDKSLASVISDDYFTHAKLQKPPGSHHHTTLNANTLQSSDGVDTLCRKLQQEVDIVNINIYNHYPHREKSPSPRLRKGKAIIQTETFDIAETTTILPQTAPVSVAAEYEFLATDAFENASIKSDTYTLSSGKSDFSADSIDNSVKYPSFINANDDFELINLKESLRPQRKELQFEEKISNPAIEVMEEPCVQKKITKSPILKLHFVQQTITPKKKQMKEASTQFNNNGLAISDSLDFRLDTAIRAREEQNLKNALQLTNDSNQRNISKRSSMLSSRASTSSFTIPVGEDETFSQLSTPSILNCSAEDLKRVASLTEAERDNFLENFAAALSKRQDSLSTITSVSNAAQTDITKETTSETTSIFLSDHENSQIEALPTVEKKLTVSRIPRPVIRNISKRNTEKQTEDSIPAKDKFQKHSVQRTSPPQAHKATPPVKKAVAKQNGIVRRSSSSDRKRIIKREPISHRGSDDFATPPPNIVHIKDLTKDLQRPKSAGANYPSKRYLTDKPLDKHSQIASSLQGSVLDHLSGRPVWL